MKKPNGRLTETCADDKNNRVVNISPAFLFSIRGGLKQMVFQKQTQVTKQLNKHFIEIKMDFFHPLKEFIYIKEGHIF